MNNQVSEVVVSEIIDMHVHPGVELTGTITKITDYRTEAKSRAFIGFVTSNGIVVHIPTDRGAKMKDLANKVLDVWNNKKFDMDKTNNVIKGLLFESNVAVMITEIKTGSNKGNPQYRFYDADASETFNGVGPHSGAARNRVDHEDFLKI